MAGDVAIVDLTQERHFDPAAVGGQRAARMEGATGRRIHRARDFALYGGSAARAARMGNRHGGKKRLRIGMQWTTVDGLLVADLNNTAEIHDGNAICDVPYDPKVV